jgi:hypothetical protein
LEASGRSKILEKLSDATKISNPENVFKMQLSDNSREVIKNQILAHTSLIHTCLKIGKFNLISTLLADLKWISELL